MSRYERVYGHVTENCANNNLKWAIVANLPAGAYSAIVAGKEGGNGVALVEIYI